MSEKVKITFYGGAGSVTGANFLIQFRNSNFLVDCGLIQGSRENEEGNLRDFAYDPTQVSHLFVTHAHMDHIGRIPKLVKEGFRGKIISTPETRDIALLSLEDAYRVMQSKEKDGFTNLMYEEKDVKKAFSLWESVTYEEGYEFEGIKVKLRDAGHILGSTIYEFTMGDRKIAFTGDLGNSPSPLLNDTEFVTDCDFMVMESVYGDRNHESHEDRKIKFKEIIQSTIKKGGDVIIPAFSIERTQVILSELDNMIEGGEIESVPVYLDSPLAARVTNVYEKYPKRFNKFIQEELNHGDDIFNFPKLKVTMSQNSSEAIDYAKSPKIIIAGSGMSEGGRVRRHEKEALPDSKNTILLVGYQPAGTLGRKLEEGIKKVNIDGEYIGVKARIAKIEGYSAHMDSNHLLEFAEKATESGKIKKIFVAMGEPKSALFLVQRIRDYLGVEAIYPEAEKVYEI